MSENNDKGHQPIKKTLLSLLKQISGISAHFLKIVGFFSSSTCVFAGDTWVEFLCPLSSATWTQLLDQSVSESVSQ